MLRSILITALFTASCQQPSEGRVRLNTGDWIAQGQIAAELFDSWQLSVEAVDVETAISTTAEPSAEMIELAVPPGRGRTLTLAGVRSAVGDSPGWDVYAGTARFDVVADAVTPVEVTVYPYGLWNADVVLTDQEVTLGEIHPVVVRALEPLSGQAAIAGLTIEQGRITAPLVEGQYEFIGDFTIEGQPFIMHAPGGIFIGTGVETQQTVYAYRASDKCADFQPSEVDQADPACFGQEVSVSGLLGGGLTVENATGESILIDEDGAYSFDERLPNGSSWSLSITAQPTGGNQTCRIAQGDDTGVLAGAAARSQIDCGAQLYDIGGVVRGLAPGETLTLSNNVGGAQLLDVGNGAFSFGPIFDDSVAYEVIAVASGASLCSVNRGIGVIASLDVADIGILCVGDVAPQYPSAAEWNSFTDPVAGFCDELVPAGCVHGGEARVLDLADTGITTCSGVNATDELGAFAWRCDDSGAAPMIVSDGLLPNVRLEDLIDIPSVAWRSNRLFLTIGADNAVTAPAAWWTNPIAIDPTGSPSIPYEVRIYTPAYSGGDISVVLPFGGSLTGVIILVQLGHTHVGTTPLSSDSADDSDMYGLWVEGSFQGTGGGPTLSIMRAHFAVLRHVTIVGGTTGLEIISNNHTRVEDVSISGTSSTGLLAQNAAFSTFTGVRVDGATDIGMWITSSAPDVVLRDITTTGSLTGLRVQAPGTIIDGLVTAFNTNDGLELSTTGPTMTRNLVRGVSAYSNGLAGVRVQDVFNSVLMDITAVGNGETGSLEEDGHGLSLLYNRNLVLMNVLAASNSVAGINLGYVGEDNQNLSIINATSANNSEGFMSSADSNIELINFATVENNFGMYVDNSEPFALRGVFVHGNNGTDCNVDDSSATALGLIAASTCTPVPPSALSADRTGSAAASFVGRVTDANVAGAGGRELGNTAATITQLERSHRTWIADDPNVDYPNAGHRLLCAGPSVTCQVFDWRLLAADTVLHQALLPPAPVDEALSFVWNTSYFGGTPIDATSCPALGFPGAVDGGGFCQTTLASFAVELAGNGNMLCDDGDDCVQSGNIASFQGEGAPSLLGSQALGAGSVQLFAYPTTGH